MKEQNNNNPPSFFNNILPKSIVGKMAMVNLIVILIMTAAMAFYIDRTIAWNMRSEHKQKGMAFVEGLAQNAPGLILSEDYAGLQELINHTIISDDDLRYAYIVDNKNDRIISHTFNGGFPVELKAALTNYLNCRGDKIGSRLLTTEEGEILDIFAPIIGGEAGCVHIGMSMNRINNDIKTMKLRLLAVALGVSLLTLLITLIYSKKINRTMSTLTTGADKIGDGNLDHRIDIDDDCEIGSLAKTFNKMAESLQNNIKQRQINADALARIENLESIGDLAAGLAHDYNNLHTAVLGNIDLAKFTTDKESRTYSFLCGSEDALRKAIQLTQQLLTFSHGGAPMRTRINIKDFFESTCHLYMNDSNCKLDIKVSESLPAVHIDPIQIGQVIKHLLQNARDAMPQGGEITLSALEVDLNDTATSIPKGKYLKVIVSDHGCGVNSEIANRIFDPYFSTKERGNKKGQGLGLSICNSIILKHGGHINYQANPAGGTSFYFYLEINGQAAISEHNAFKKPQPQPDPITKILVMDDEDIVRDVTEQMLSQLDCQVLTAKDGVEAIKIFKEAEKSGQPFTATILDLIVPNGMGGVETAKELLKINPAAKLIATSGYSDDPVMKNFADFGFCQSLAKPYQINKLRQVISQLA